MKQQPEKTVVGEPVGESLECPDCSVHAVYAGGGLGWKSRTMWSWKRLLK
jgi:hypothetical protein